MKKILILLFYLLVSFNAYGDWTKIIKEDNKTYFIYFDNIKQKDGLVYWWLMASESEDSYQIYLLSDCDMSRMKPIQIMNYRKPLGKGEPSVGEIDDDKWIFLPPETTPTGLHSVACEYANLPSDKRESFLVKLKLHLQSYE
jgi:hypothetical protein